MRAPLDLCRQLEHVAADAAVPAVAALRSLDVEVDGHQRFPAGGEEPPGINLRIGIANLGRAGLGAGRGVPAS